MSDFAIFVGPLIGMLGVIVGTVLNEFLRRGRRTEQYSTTIFEKRLEAYEKLMNLLHAANEIADEVIQNSKLSHKERHDLISSAIFPIAEFVDRNSLYIDEELGTQCVALFMGVEDIQEAPEPKKQDDAKHFYEMRRETYRMIREDSGVAAVNKLFRSINRPRITSPVIEAIRALRRKQQKIK